MEVTNAQNERALSVVEAWWNQTKVITLANHKGHTIQ